MCFTLMDPTIVSNYLWLVTSILSLGLVVEEWLAWSDCHSNSITQLIYNNWRDCGGGGCCCSSRNEGEDSHHSLKIVGSQVSNSLAASNV